MSAKASSDFGLYKTTSEVLDSKKNKKCVTTNCVAVAGISVFLLFIVVLLIVKLTESRSESLPNNQTSHLRYHPRGFATGILGPIPRQFVPQTTTERPKVTTLSYPQLSYRSTVHHPRNIQDILGYMTRKSNYKIKTQSEASNLESAFTPAENKVMNDPFFRFKPGDPSDINLLATASFRFAPPVWKNFLRNKQPPQQTTQQSSTIQSILREKPLSITLNIFPMDEDGQRPLSARSQRKTNKVHRGDDARMTINLKVYPEVVGAEELDQIYAETKLRKKPSNTVKFEEDTKK